MTVDRSELEELKRQFPDRWSEVRAQFVRSDMSAVKTPEWQMGYEEEQERARIAFLQQCGYAIDIDGQEIDSDCDDGDEQ